MFGASKRAIKRLLKDFEASGSYSVEEVSKDNILYSKPTFLAKFHDGSHEMRFAMKSETVEIIQRGSDGSINPDEVEKKSFRKYLTDESSNLNPGPGRVPKYISGRVFRLGINLRHLGASFLVCRYEQSAMD